MRRLLTCILLFTVGSIGFAGDPPLTADGGLLVYSWFSHKPLAEDGMKDVDFAWVKPGLNLNGHTISVRKWAAPKLMNDPSDKDKTRASVFSVWFPGIVRLAFDAAGQGKGIKCENDGDLYIVGRLVSCTAGNTVAKALIGFGAGTSTATWDIALIDRQTKEVLAGFHHKVGSHSSFSTLDTKAQSWAFAWATTFVTAAWNPTPDVPVSAYVEASTEVPESMRPPVAPTPTPTPTPTPVATPAPKPAAPIAEIAKTGGTQDLAADLERLDRLHKQGLLTDAEYESLRKQAVTKASGN